MALFALGWFFRTLLSFRRQVLTEGSILFRDARALVIKRGVIFACSFRKPRKGEPEQESNSLASLGMDSSRYPFRYLRITACTAEESNPDELDSVVVTSIPFGPIPSSEGITPCDRYHLSLLSQLRR